MQQFTRFRLTYEARRALFLELYKSEMVPRAIKLYVRGSVLKSCHLVLEHSNSRFE